MQGYHKHESVMSKDELENDEFMKNLFKKKSEIKMESVKFDVPAKRQILEKTKKKIGE